MADMRQPILRGTAAAARTHHELRSREQWEQNGGRIDVFRAIDRRGLWLMFRPLDGLLGAYLDHPSRAILINTQRPWSVRRYTAAHELGHHILGHQTSVDGAQMIARSPFRGGYDPQEVEADAFAIAFLVPLWFVAGVMRQRSWKSADMVNPANVYQLSLRAGASYEATCYALRNHKVVDTATSNKLTQMQPKKIKEALLTSFEPDNWWLDVWGLNETDNKAYLDLTLNDVIEISLAEHSGGGYMWDVAGIAQADFEVISDRREQTDTSNAVGSHVRRRVTARAKSEGVGSVQFVERRPWEAPGQPLNSYQFTYDVQGIQKSGLLDAQLERMAGAVE